MHGRSKCSATRASRLCSALAEVVERRAHFSYSDSAEMLSGNSDLNEKLRQRLEQAEAERTRAREALRSHAAQLSQYSGFWPR